MFQVLILVMKVPPNCPASLPYPYTYFTAHTMLETRWAVNDVVLKLQTMLDSFSETGETALTVFIVFKHSF